jgi:transketolase
MTSATLISLRDAFGELILKFGADNPRIVVLDADLSQSTRTAAFRERYPERYLNVGIAEQNMVSVAAGIALGGGLPLVNTFAAFLTRRAADQIAISVAFPSLDVKFFGFHAGVNLGEDGATQQSVEDLGIMQAIPGIRVYSPCDARDLDWAMHRAFSIRGPTYVRLARFPSPAELGAENSRGGFRVLRKSEGPVVLTTGTLATEVLEVAEKLATEDVDLAVIGVRQIKPLDQELADMIEQRPPYLAVVEEHNIHGGLADAASALLDGRRVPHVIERIGITDRFGESGPPRALLEYLGLAGDPLVARLRNWYQRCPPSGVASYDDARPAPLSPVTRERHM